VLVAAACGSPATKGTGNQSSTGSSSSGSRAGGGSGTLTSTGATSGVGAAGAGSGVGAAGAAGAGSGGGAAGAGSGGGAAGAGSGGGAAGAGSGGTPCVPPIPMVAWTSPYAGWSRGIPTEPTFFPIAVWLQIPMHAMELSNIGINIYIGNNAGTDTLMAADLTTLKGLGMYAIIGQDSVGLANIDDTTIVGWWMTPDEPDNAQAAAGGGYGPPVAPATMVTQYNSYKATDSTRPIYLGLGQGVAYANYEGRGSNPPAESGYVPASDIIAFDIYPYNNCSGDANEQVTCGQFWLNALGVDDLHQWSNRNQAVWTDFETTVINAGTTDGPTPAETISEVWLALIHSANGIIYFIDSWNPSFREDAIFESSAMVSAVTGLNQQIKSLAPELNSASLPNLVKVASSNAAAPVDIMVKANGSALYVFSALSRSGTTTATFAITGMTGNGVAGVVGESRTIDIVAGSFSDAFAANGVHIYRIDLSTVTCN
jgi:hypothetical protein